jgi:ribonucleotide monophosphatase NagD (HAD superfamily)
VRRKNEILHRLQRENFQRLFVENVERRRRHMTLFQRLRQVASFTSSPRAQFTSRTPFFIFLIAPSLIMPAVCGVRPTCNVM